MNLNTKPDYDQCIARIDAWYNRQIIDRVPIRFHRHNAEYDNMISDSKHATLKDKWMDAEFQAKAFLDSVKGKTFLGETFPVYMPNLGPNFYAATHGVELEFGEVTSWLEPIVKEESDIDKIKFDRNNIYYKSMHELTKAGLEYCKDEFLVGYTDIHTGMDCAEAWRGAENLCMDMMINPDFVHQLVDKAYEHFLEVYNDFDAVLKAAGQPSVTWLNIPVPNGRQHIPSNDFSFMISPEQFDEFSLPGLKEELKTMTHNVYHIDGLGVANHTDSILSTGIRAIQWVQGMADDYPIMQHVPYIKKMQAAGASVIVDLSPEDLEPFMNEVNPEGIFLWVATDSHEQEHAIMKRLLKWK